MSVALYDRIKVMSKITDSVLVGFSGGKDSIVTMDLCFKYFKKVVPFFMYIGPDLSFQENMLKWYERCYNTHIIRVPHMEVSEFFRYGTFRTPDMEVPIISITDIYDYLRITTGIWWIAAGERISDSIIRRAMIKHSSSIDMQRGRFYPIAEWNKSEVMQYIKAKRLKLGEDSKKLNFSFKSLEGRELAFVKQYYPEDYNKLLRLYPYADAAVMLHTIRFLLMKTDRDTGYRYEVLYMAEYDEIDYLENQPIKGVPVVQVGERFHPMEPPVDKGCNEDKTVFWFIYQGSKKGKLTIDTVNMTETLEEVT